MHREQLSKQYAMQAATALRIGYYHATETFLSLIGAWLQAPFCPHAWILKCGTDDLESVVSRITNADTVFNQHSLDAVTWETVATKIFAGANCEEPQLSRTIDDIAKYWEWTSHQFLDENNRNEYNSAKHGFRLKPGGFTLSFGAESVPGNPAAPEAMTMLGGSKFGNSFYVPLPKRSAKSFYANQHSLNWNPEAMAANLELLAMSIHNVISAIRVANRHFDKPIAFKTLENASAFELGIKDRPQVPSLAMNVPIPESELGSETREQMLEILRKCQSCRNVPVT